MTFRASSPVSAPPTDLLTYFIRGGEYGVIDSTGVIELAAGQRISFDLASGGDWFGHGFHHVQSFPWQLGSLSNPDFAVNNIQSPIWMCSRGVVLMVDTRRKLDVRLNEKGEGKLEISCADDDVIVRHWVAPTLPEAHRKLMAFLGWPNRPPKPSRFGDSFFCTWTQFPRCINQERVIAMGEEIHRRGYPCSTLIIDDRWEASFGELEFAEDFPDPGRMVARLHELGIEVWLWITPFVNQESKGFEDLAEKGILVPHRSGKGAARFRWWGGTAGLVDVTAPQGREWLRGKLEFLRDHFGIDGFKIDGGDFKYQPSPSESNWHEFLGESGYSDQLLAVFEDLVPNQCESRTAWLSQKRSILWRQGGKDSHWGADNGLKAMVRLGLHLALLGYDLSIPDMVPGRVQTLKSDEPLPTDELMVRWTEVSAFMPFLQFSYFPWNYAPETERVVWGYAQIHKLLENYLVEQSTDRTAPLIRPAWYGAPEEKELFRIDDQFLLGDDLLVAPVLEEGQVSRTVILPPGEWVDAYTKETLQGGEFPDYPAPCPGIPLFVRKARMDLVEQIRPQLLEVSRVRIQLVKTTASYSAGLNRDLSVTG
ncbi:glycoside hydrolase family 31 protein [Puniceicoccus vermicola]|uniref:Glycoside hydrolase n=1 Tax=Puniceicoccus vermicola TaxID=388746 RepID=A0A7X1B3C5_9BACT|nr:glycoside hydrolase family 31 protein [Puniceicoccus vermicola]MBC2603778.1 hypothetical protein [Puniceicoccus vermicola]